MARKSGAQAQPWRLAPRSLEIADTLRPLVPGYTESDEVQLRLLALVLCRLELAEQWLAERGSLFAPGMKGDVFPVVRLMSSWESQASKLCGSLGLTPAARARIDADDASATTSRALEQHLRDSYSDGDVS